MRTLVFKHQENLGHKVILPANNPLNSLGFAEYQTLKYTLGEFLED